MSGFNSCYAYAHPVTQPPCKTPLRATSKPNPRYSHRKMPKGEVMPKVGDKIGLRELQARWAYSELVSPRQILNYCTFAGFEPLFEKARQNIPFEDLDNEETDYLFVMNDGVRAPLAAMLKPFPVFACESWRRDKIAQALTIAFDRGNQLTFETYANNPLFAPGQRPDPGDFRLAALLMPANEKSFAEPVPLVPTGNSQFMLLDGYLRSLLFLRSTDPDRRLLVWIPDQSHALP